MTGRLPMREDARVIVECFVLLGAPLIAAGIVVAGASAAKIEPALPPSDKVSIDRSSPPLPQADYDP